MHSPAALGTGVPVQPALGRRSLCLLLILAAGCLGASARAQECGVWLPVAGASGDMLGITFGGGKFVAVGNTGAHTSADGGAWTDWPIALGGWSLVRVGWNGAGYLAVGNGGNVYTSPDGQAWTPRASQTTRGLAGVAWGNNTWVVTGDYQTIITSPDGIAWTTTHTAPSGYLTSVAWTGTAFVAVGQGGVVLTSPNGASWTPGSIAGEDWLTDVIWTGSQLVAVAFDGTVLASQNGASWTPRAQTGAELRRILWTGARYVAAGDDNTLLGSPDTVEWQQESVDGDPPNGGITGLAWSGSAAIAVGRPSGVFRSHCGVWADFAFTPTSPQIGQETGFSATRAQGIGRARWDFGEAGCDGAAPVRELVCLGFPCTFPTTFAFASAGEKAVKMWGWAGERDGDGNPVFVLLRSRKLTVAATGACSTCQVPGSPGNPSPPHQTVRAGGTVALSWVAPATGTPPFAYDVELDGATVCQGATATVCQVTGVAESAALHTWRVIARNACGEKASPDWKFLACSAPGKPVADFDWMPAGPLPTWPLQQQPFSGQEVAFVDHSSRTPDDWAWSGLSAAGLIPGPAPRATWWAAGAHDIGLRAANCLGWSNEIVKTVTVSPDVRPRRWAFDFGTDTSAVATGFVGVRQGTAYTPARGHGWTAGTVTARERAAGDDLSRDFHFTVNATFVVDVPARAYDVTVWLGDTGRAHDEMALYLEGQLWDVVSPGVGEVERRVFRVDVTDGQLTIQVRDLGGADPNAVINGIEVVVADPVRLDLGTATSPVEAGFMGAGEGHRWAAPLWCGWSAGRVSSRDRGSGSDLRRDLHVTQDATFACAVGRGLWNVSLTLGDQAVPHDQMGLFLEGELAGTVSTGARQFAVARHRLAIADGELTVRLDDLGGIDVNVVVNAIEAVRVGPFDFGPTPSQVASGYTAVSQGTRYSSASGFGWLEGVVGSRDRGSGTALLRDFVMTGAATFAVDVPNGAYVISVQMGDATNAHDDMAVILEGVQAAVVSTSKGQVHARTYRTVVSDGQLSVRLVDLGGADANAVINGLSIAPAP